MVISRTFCPAAGNAAAARATTSRVRADRYMRPRGDLEVGGAGRWSGGVWCGASYGGSAAGDSQLRTRAEKAPQEASRAVAPIYRHCFDLRGLLSLAGREGQNRDLGWR